MLCQGDASLIVVLTLVLILRRSVSERGGETVAQHRARARARIPVEDVVDYLGGLGFPCSKEDISSAAVSSGNVSFMNVPAPDSQPARYLSLSGVRWGG